MHPLLKSSTLEYYLIALPGALIAGAILSALSFVVELPWIG